MKLQTYLEAFKALPADISQAEAHLEEQSQKTVTVQGGKAVSTQAYTRSAIYVRATGQRTGVTYTENLAEAPVAVMRRALQNARLVTAAEEITLTPPGLAYPDYPSGQLEIPSFDELRHAAVGLEQQVVSLCGEARLASCSLTYTRYADEVANSLGLAVNSACGYFALEGQIVAEAGRGKGEKRLKLLSDRLDNFHLEAVLPAAATARWQAAPVAVPSGTYDIVIAGEAACDFLFMLWRSMSAAQHRQAGATFAGLEGQRIGASCVNLLSSGLHPACPIRYRFDNEGMPVAHTRLMDQGVFRSLMHNRSTARAAGVPSTGNGGRRITMSGVIQVPLLVTPKVLYLEPGEARRDELLRRLGQGLVIETVLDSFHGIDYASGEFSVPVMCTIVREGQVGAASLPLVWTGNLKAVLNKTKAVGGELHFSCFRDSFTLGASDMLVQAQNFSGAGNQ
jgi:PmbA protein